MQSREKNNPNLHEKNARKVYKCYLKEKIQMKWKCVQQTLERKVRRTWEGRGNICTAGVHYKTEVLEMQIVLQMLQKWKILTFKNIPSFLCHHVRMSCVTKLLCLLCLFLPYFEVFIYVVCLLIGARIKLKLQYIFYFLM